MLEEGRGESVLMGYCVNVGTLLYTCTFGVKVKNGLGEKVAGQVTVWRR